MNIPPSPDPRFDPLLRLQEWFGLSKPQEKLYNALLVVGLMVAYIGWQLHGETQLRNIDATRRKVTELNAELTHEKSKLTEETRQSKVIERIADSGLRDFRDLTPPTRVIIPRDCVRTPLPPQQAGLFIHR